MMAIRRIAGIALLGLNLLGGPLAAPALADRPQIDRSGRETDMQLLVRDPSGKGAGRVGRGSYDLAGDLALSNSLPAGSTLRVTNPANGRWAMVRVGQQGEPRGAEQPTLVVGPRVAALLGLPPDGTAGTVRVAPLAVPQADGTVRLGEGTGMPGQRAVIVHPERG
ncbi:septal ring lytic transglycosylase RlpA family protein [Roseomonas gilardii subsp. gilardii]|uniref:septal ring lytic transglycosylase RlpA family protein n=1 Tax=Roseomonas gilardii TaxID=257708 RepID=UPI001FF7B2F0|nr:septal ring lytic transglycosylase RlpA family protein [Roseomonas gilardii]UPG74271.1 septal ring lytic transglycosylase RlpA family protein [Roseomonas gilardii subsp. gilardii]